MTLDDIRSHFPHTASTIYLNHAATGPLSTPVLEAIQRYLRQRHGDCIDNFFAFEPVVRSARERIARLVSAPVERVEFAPNTSYGLNILALGLDWRPGDRIALPACEFPSNVYPFLNLERRGVIVDFIPHNRGIITLEDIERTLRPETRLLSISWVQFLSGMKTNLNAVGRLCRDREVIFCVDAIQGLGALRLDVEEAGIDFLASGAHKWIMAAQGIGLIYVSEKLQDQIVPAAGWQHGPVDWENFFDYRLDFHPDARRFRLGTMNNIGIASLDAALALYESAGADWCEEQVLARSQQLASGLECLGLARYGSADPEHASGIVAFEHPRPEALKEHLSTHGIEASVRQGLVRFSPTYYNTPEEIDRTLEVIEAFGSR